MKRTVLIYKPCPICKKVFSTDKCNNRRYCSEKCLRIGLKLRHELRENGNCRLDIRQPIDAIDESGYEKLKSAIIIQAIKDYKAALKSKGKYSASSLEKFFKSKWGQRLSDDNGERIIRYCKYKRS